MAITMQQGPSQAATFKSFLNELADDEIYSPGSIVDLAKESGFLDDDNPANLRVQMTHLRIYLIRKSHKAMFPPKGEGTVRKPGQAPIPGWYGSTWKRA